MAQPGWVMGHEELALFFSFGVKELQPSRVTNTF